MVRIALTWQRSLLLARVLLRSETVTSRGVGMWTI